MCIIVLFLVLLHKLVQGDENCAYTRCLNKKDVEYVSVSCNDVQTTTICGKQYYAYYVLTTLYPGKLKDEPALTHFFRLALLIVQRESVLQLSSLSSRY